MRSYIFSFSADKNTKLDVSDADYGHIQRINYSTDYIGEDYSIEETLEDCKNFLTSIFPAFIKVSEDGTIRVSSKSKTLYHKWIKSHILKVRKWQDTQFLLLHGTYVFEKVDIITESKNPDEWLDTDFIFNLFENGFNNFNGYTEFVADLACYHQGETLYLIGSTDYHF